MKARMAHNQTIERSSIITQSAPAFAALSVEWPAVINS
jgi:hypothetical protein